jgi:hypothetical protein
MTALEIIKILQQLDNPNIPLRVYTNTGIWEIEELDLTDAYETPQGVWAKARFLG